MYLALVRLFIWLVAICLTSLSFADVTEKALSAPVDKRELDHVNGVSDRVAKSLMLRGDAAKLCHKWGLCLEFSASDFSITSFLPFLFSSATVKKTIQPLIASTAATKKMPQPLLAPTAAVKKTIQPLVESTAAVKKTIQPLVASTATVKKTSQPLLAPTAAVKKTIQPLVASTVALKKTIQPLTAPVISIEKTSRQAEKPKRYTMLDGRDIFVANCMSCHLNEASGAPMLTVSEDWSWRVQSGVDFLVSATIAGKPYRPSSRVDKDSDRYVVDSIETVAKSPYDDVERGCELPRGGCAQCSDAEIIAVVKYMVQAAAEGNENYSLW